jgi:preprotein translocase subunit SecB
MAEQEKETKNPEFNIQRLYIKDISFETPNSPEMFKTEWKPEVNVDLHVENKLLEEDVHEVVLKVTITTKLDKKTAFLAEVSQAGIFTLKNFADEQFKAMLGSFCPNILFPYAREAVSDLTNRGGFPPLYLAPINFDALYQQQLEKDKGGTVH